MTAPMKPGDVARLDDKDVAYLVALAAKLSPGLRVDKGDVRRKGMTLHLVHAGGSVNEADFKFASIAIGAADQIVGEIVALRSDRDALALEVTRLRRVETAAREYRDSAKELAHALVHGLDTERPSARRANAEAALDLAIAGAAERKP